MRRFSSILVSILLGALSVAIGMGFFLQKANADRAHLADIAEQAQSQVQEAKQIRDQAVDEANKKLHAANTEIKKAQDALIALKQERDLIAQATVLNEPTPKEIKNWKQAINATLGISIRYPTILQETANDKTNLVLSRIGGSSSTTQLVDTRWISVQAYDASEEQALLNSLGSVGTSTPFSYLINGHLLIGTQIIQSQSQQLFLIAHTSLDGQKAHLLWAKVPVSDQKNLLLALRTLDFQQ